MEKLPVIEKYLDQELRIDFISDACSNGLEVSGKQDIEKIAFMVDASEQGISEAVEKKADMVIVHHGLFFGNIKRINGLLYNRIKLLMNNDISLYAAHLPLDVHPSLGNNAQLAMLLGLENTAHFSVGGYSDLLVLGDLSQPLNISDLMVLVKDKIHPSPRCLAFGPEIVKKVAVISGSGAEAVEMASSLGADVFLTGEPKLAAYHNSKESGVNIVFAGHYCTEVFGLKALMKHLTSKFKITAEFIDIPTEL